MMSGLPSTTHFTPTTLSAIPNINSGHFLSRLLAELERPFFGLPIKIIVDNQKNLTSSINTM